MAIITWVWHGAKNGILAKNAEWLLKLRKSQIIVFDKTGTITEGKPQLVEIHSDSKDDHIDILAAIEAESSHPIAHAVVEYAKEHKISLPKVEHFKNLEGVGVQGDVGGKTYVISKPAHLVLQWIAYDEDLIQKRTSQGKTPLILTSENSVIAYYAVADEIKATTKQAIKDIKALGIKTVMLTWDHSNTANYIASLVGIDRVYAEVNPEDKAAIVADLKKEWVVTMVWDGINDAPALATADVGVAMSTGTDVAIESAELTLLHGDLQKLVKAIKISHLTQSAIVQNLSWAFGFNLIWIPLAAWLFYPIVGVLLDPAFEWAAMAMSSLTVMLNSWRLQQKKI